MPQKSAAQPGRGSAERPAELVMITGLSGSGKGTVLKNLEDLGYYSVDNLPVDLIPKFAELTRDSASVRRAALVVDVREGKSLQRLPEVYGHIRHGLQTRLVFLEADDETIVRRFSETRRPHPLGADRSIIKSIQQERRQLAPIRAMADLIINTSKFTVHELRDHIRAQFQEQPGVQDPGVRDQLRIPPRGAGGQRPGFRRALSAEPELHSALQAAHRAAPLGRQVHPFVSADSRVHRKDLGPADLPAAALHSRGEELPDHRLWVHGGTPSLGDDRR